METKYLVAIFVVLLVALVLQTYQITTLAGKLDASKSSANLQNSQTTTQTTTAAPAQSFPTQVGGC
ncbi:MAG: hypothetical protein HZA83_02450 [Thaumarchaeota archaeon]|nr:hypothetical protein [Nitrososphaerota archaeon]